jgi:hypothetical protein
MIKDSLNSIFDNIKERTTNPFLGTLIVVWIVHNWTLVYSMFYFDSSFKLLNRVEYIEKYFVKKPFLEHLVYVVGITIVVLVLTYVMLSISRLITDTQEKIVVPQISKLVAGKTYIVLKKDYDTVVELTKDLYARVDEERLAKVAAQNERDESDKKYLNIKTQYGVDTDTYVQAQDISKTDPIKRTSSRREELTSLGGTLNDFISSELSGIVNFDYSNNSGYYRIGTGEFEFELRFLKASNTSIYMTNDSPTLNTIALVKDLSDIRLIIDPTIYNDSSRTRCPKLNEIVVAKNVSGYYAAIKILDIRDDSRGDSDDQVTFEYVIQSDHTANFTKSI